LTNTLRFAHLGGVGKRDAPRRSRQDGKRGKVPGSGGKKRGQMEIDEITHQVAMSILANYGRTEIGRALGKYLQAKGWQDDATPMPAGTVDDYIRRANEQLNEQRELTREEARKAQINRLKRRMVSADADKRHKDALDIEDRLMEIEGTRLPREIEVGSPGGGPLIPRGPAEVLAALERFVGGGPKPAGAADPAAPAPAAATVPDSGANGPTEA
jgi:hypothetical protein